MLISETSIKSLNINDFNTNETISDSLLEKFQNISCANYERVLKKVTVTKEPNIRPKPFYGLARQSNMKENFVSAMGRYFSSLAAEPHHLQNDLTLGISIVQGSDGNVYVKDIVHGGPGNKSGVQIGDQVSINLYFTYSAHYYKVIDKIITTDILKFRSKILVFDFRQF